MQNKAFASMQSYERLTPEDDQSDIALATPQRGVPITVLIADDHPVIRDGLTLILNSQRDIMVVADAADGEEAYSLCQLLLPSIVILDLRLPKKDGIQILRELRSRKTSKPKVVIMTSYDTQEDIRSAVRAGAKAFLTKVADPQEICEAMRRRNLLSCGGSIKTG
jgi:DNA-binding NarL/FixJ family response regulator